MLLQNCLKEIYFDRPQLLFMAGESITGKIRLNGGNRSGCKIYGFQLVLTRDIIDTSLWPTEDQEGSNRLPLRLRSRPRPSFDAIPRCSFNFTSSSQKPIELQPNATLELPFRIDLDPSLWSTFVTRYGYIWYGLKFQGTIKFQKYINFSVEKFEEVILEKDVVIIGLVEGPPPTMPISERSSCSRSSFYKSKNGELVKLQVKMEKVWAIPGEILKFRVEVINGMRLPLNMIKVIFQQNVVYNLMRVVKEGKILLHKEGPSIPPGPGRRINWDGQLEIPYIVPSGLGCQKCPHMDVQYGIQFSITKFVNLRVSFPIHVGTAVKDEEINDQDLDTVSLAYGLEMSRNITGSQYSLDLDSISVASGASYWTSVQDLVANSGLPERRRGSAPPPYQSEWELERRLSVESPPPLYEDVVGK